MIKRIQVFLQVMIVTLLLVKLSTEVAAAENVVGKDRITLFFGVYTQWYQFNQALPNYDIKISNAHSQRVQDFPSVKELLQSKLVILSDVSGNEFTEAQVKLLKSYLDRGGSMLIMGGPFTLGLGQFKEQGISDLLPVDLTDFDLKWEKEGKPLTKAMDHPALEGVDLSKSPMVYWIHRVTPKKDTRILMKAGDYPLLLLGDYGKGRIAVFTGTPMGLPPKGQTPFWEWEDWKKLVRQLVVSLAAKEEQQ